jgi:acyl-CoA thioesterase-1
MKFAKAAMFVSALVAAGLALTGFASAQIVALGASNVAGYGVSSTEAWPAQLESMLRARGSSAHVANAGISGNTTGQVLARLSSAVPVGTKLVILAIGPFNDLRTGGNTDVAQANLNTIRKQLRDRGVRVIDAYGIMTSIMRQPGMLQGDQIHLTAEGHRRLAAQLARSVS